MNRNPENQQWCRPAARSPDALHLWSLGLDGGWRSLAVCIDYLSEGNGLNSFVLVSPQTERFSIGACWFCAASR